MMEQGTFAAADAGADESTPGAISESRTRTPRPRDSLLDAWKKGIVPSRWWEGPKNPVLPIANTMHAILAAGGIKTPSQQNLIASMHEVSPVSDAASVHSTENLVPGNADRGRNNDEVSPISDYSSLNGGGRLDDMGDRHGEFRSSQVGLAF
jgi:hypothetical protein